MKFIERIASLKSLAFQFWFWLINVPPFVLAYCVMGNEAFVSFSLLYLGLITIITAALGALSSLVAEKVRLKQEQDADVQDVLDVVEKIVPRTGTM